MGVRERRDGSEREKGWEGESEGMATTNLSEVLLLENSRLFSSLVATAVPYICNGGHVQLKQVTHVHTSTCMNTTPYLNTHMHAHNTHARTMHTHASAHDNVRSTDNFRLN